MAIWRTPLLGRGIIGIGRATCNPLDVAAAIDALACEPRPPGARELTGTSDTYRIRVGDYCVIYEVTDDVLIVSVIRIGHRRDVYRKR
jgi:mRNA interferase RelE/StbE